MHLIFFAIGLIASIVGAICGIGGGIIIKPALDSFGLMSVSAISFLSACTVLSMSAFSVFRDMTSGASCIDLKIGLPLSVGGAVGGILGNKVFSSLVSHLYRPDQAGAVQAFFLLLLAAGVFIYTWQAVNIRTFCIHNVFICLAIGIGLGVVSSFLGIGGGPIDLVVLYYFFSMDTKTAAKNALFIILFAQATNLFCSMVSGNIPSVPLILLFGMAGMGILGASIGRRINKMLSERMVSRLFKGVLLAIMVICIFNMRMYYM